MKPFESFMARQLEDFLLYRHCMGYANNSARSALLAFDQYLQTQGVDRQPLEPRFFLELREKINKPPRTVNTILSVLRSFFQYLVRQGVCTDNPLQDVPPLPQTYFVPFVFSPEQIELLIASAGKHIRQAQEHFLTDLAIYVAIVLLARCGMRINEPLRALRTHYRSDDGTLYIEKTKFKKDRLIPLPKAALIEVENYLAVYKICCSNDKSPYLLFGKKGNQLRDEQVRRAFYKAVKDIGIDKPKQIIGNLTFGKPTPHSLRHSFALNDYLLKQVDLHYD